MAYMFWHSIWHYFRLFSHILSDILSGIYSNILSGIHSHILSGSCDVALRWRHTPQHPQLARKKIMRGRRRGRRGRRGRRRRRGRRGRNCTFVLTSRGPHLAGGEQPHLLNISGGFLKPQSSSIVMGFSTTNHPAIGVPPGRPPARQDDPHHGSPPRWKWPASYRAKFDCNSDLTMNVIQQSKMLK